jgi:hypothetical protein
VTALEIWLLCCLLIMVLAIMQFLVSIKPRSKKKTSSTNSLPIFSNSENNRIEIHDPVPSDHNIKEKTIESPTQTKHIVERVEESFSHHPTRSVKESNIKSTFTQSSSIPLSIYLFSFLFTSFACLYWIFFLYFV